MNSIFCPPEAYWPQGFSQSVSLDAGSPGYSDAGSASSLIGASTSGFESYAIEKRLRAAVASGDLDMRYQPIVSLSTRRLSGIEASIRWHDAYLGATSPADFLAYAAASDLASALDAIAFRRACKDHRELMELGIDVPLSINLSSHSLHDDNLLQLVNEAIFDSGLSPEFLDLGVTTRVAVADDPTLSANLRLLRDLGVSLSLYDFYVAPSTLGWFRRFGFRRWKLDRALTQLIPSDTTHMGALFALIDLAGALRMETLAEGVESNQQCDFLRESGCKYGQGSIFAPAMAHEQLRVIISQRWDSTGF